MKTSDPYAEAYAQAARAAERCQYHTPSGRQCACLIQDPQSKFCPRHSESPSTDTQNFADLLAEHAEDFQTAEGINHSLAQLFRLLAGGQISTRRATGLAYIAILLLRTLPAINGSESTQYEIVVPPGDDFPSTEPGEDDPQGFAPVEHSPQQPIATTHPGWCTVEFCTPVFSELTLSPRFRACLQSQGCPPWSVPPRSSTNLPYVETTL